MSDDDLEQTPNDNGSARAPRPIKPKLREELTTRWRVLLGWGLILASIVLLAVGWYGVSGTPIVARQLAYLVSGALGGLLAGIVGVGLLVSTDVRRDRERLGRVEAALLEVREMLVAQSAVLSRLNETGANGADRASTRSSAKQRR